MRTDEESVDVTVHSRAVQRVVNDAIRVGERHR